MREIVSDEEKIINKVKQRLLEEKERYLKIPPLLKHVNDSIDIINKIKLYNGNGKKIEIQRISRQETIIPIGSISIWVKQRTSYRDDEKKLSLPVLCKSILQEELTKYYAQKVGVFIPPEEIEKWDYKTKGFEAFVYENPYNSDEVYKIVRYNKVMGGDLSDFFDRLLAFNEMSPLTSYNLVGFTEYENKLTPVVSQPIIVGNEIVSGNEYEEFKEQYRKMDYEIVQDEEDNELIWLKKEGYIAKDLHWRNVLKTQQGEYVIIDANIRKDID
ncbi:hypothetical protein AGMMS50239_33280 [Bacteroidia bacterium]|nr:hypothetical protein AGMMS50239_33280 [Bacteroidia bacterium]